MCKRRSTAAVSIPLTRPENLCVVPYVYNPIRMVTAFHFESVRREVLAVAFLLVAAIGVQAQERARDAPFSCEPVLADSIVFRRDGPFRGMSPASNSCDSRSRRVSTVFLFA